MDRKIAFLTYVVPALALFAWMMLFLLYLLPMLSPVFLERFWTIWLIGGLFFGPFILLLAYLIARTNGVLHQLGRTHWRNALIGTPLVLAFLSALGYIFSTILPPDFEPFRSLTLPCLVFVLVLMLLSKTGHFRKYQATGKQQT